MDDDILSRKVGTVKRQKLEPYRRTFRTQGSTFYDFSSRNRQKNSYSMTNLGSRQPLDNNRQTVPTSTHQNLPSSSNPSSSLSSALENTLVVQNEPFLNEEELYMNLLHSCGSQSLSISDGIGEFMVLPDLDFPKSQLKKDHFILLQRKVISFPSDSLKWIYTCSCQRVWSEEILSTSNHCCISYEAFMRQYPQCIHRRVCSNLYTQYDNLHQLSPTDYFMINSEDMDHGYSTNENSVIVEAARMDNIPVVRVWSEMLKSHGLVSVLKKKYFCFCCTKNFCDHTKKIRNLVSLDSENDIYHPVIEEFKDHFISLENNSDSTSTNNIPKCHSFKKIPYKPTEHLCNVFSTGIIRNIPKHNGNMVFLPELTNCRHCGGDLNDADPVANEWLAGKDVLVVTNTYIGFGNVYYRPCLNCDSVTLFDGLENCILNMGSYLVGYDVLRSYMHSFLHGRRPLYTFYQTFLDDHKDYGNKIETFFSYHKLRSAWLAFLNLLDIDFGTGFSCPDCPGDGPDIIICDGTSLSFQRRMWTWNDFEVSTKPSSKIASSFSDRVFILEEELRKLLLRYAAGGSLFRGKHHKPLLLEEKKRMFSLLEKYPSLLLFLRSIDDGALKLPKIFLSFITSIASKSPVCGYLHPSKDVGLLINDLVNGVLVKEDPQKWQGIHNHMPILFGLLEGCQTSCAPLALRPLLSELWEVALYPFVNCDVLDDSKDLLVEDELSFFPALPVCRERGVFKLDSTKVEKTCRKTYKGHPSLLPGVFTMYCPHGMKLIIN